MTHPKHAARLAVPAAVAATVLLGCSTVVGPTAAPSAPGPVPTAVVASPAPSAEAPFAVSGALRLVTLGDAYTSGYPVRPQNSWPSQLVRALGPEISIVLARNLAARGQTSADVIEDQLAALPGIGPHIVTIQVGANDIISPDIDLQDYRANLRTIFDAVLEEVPAGRVFAITTPDYTLTPGGGDFRPRDVHRSEIRRANEILEEEAATRGIRVIDISPVSDRVPADPTLVASDGLYPSAKQYSGWVELIAPHIRRALETGGAAG